MKEFWRRCEMTVGCRDSDGEAMVAHSRQSVGARAVYAGYWEVWPTLFSKGDSKPLRSIFTREELQHLLEEGLRRPGTNGNKEMLFALAAELREGRLVTYSSTAEVRLLALAWAGGRATPPVSWQFISRSMATCALHTCGRFDTRARESRNILLGKPKVSAKSWRPDFQAANVPG